MHFLFVSLLKCRLFIYILTYVLPQNDNIFYDFYIIFLKINEINLFYKQILCTYKISLF